MHTPRSASVLFVLAGAAAAAPRASAQTLNWVNLAGGSASTAANWSPVGVPGAANDLVFNLAAAYPVSWNSSVTLSNSHTLKRGTVTYTLSSPHSITGALRVGDVSGDSSTLVVASGTLNAGTSVSLGHASGAAGTLTVDGESGLVATTAAGSDIFVGNAGTGTLNITNGARVVPADDVSVGVAATGVGHLTVSGDGGLPLPIPSSTLDADLAGQTVTIGNLGDGFLDVLAGGQVMADNLTVALAAGSNGSVTVGGTGLLFPSKIAVTNTLRMGDNTGGDGGSASLSVNNQGVLDVGGAIRVGDSGGIGSGTLSVNTGGAVTCGSLILADAGGFLNMLGGSLTVDGGSLTARNDQLVLSSSTGQPEITLTNSASCSLSAPAAPFEALVLGRSGFGSFNVQFGSTLTVSAGDVIVADQAGSTGFLALIGGSAATLPSTRSLVIGDLGTGRLDLESNSHLRSGAARLGAGAGSRGAALVEDGAGGAPIWDITGTLALGGTIGSNTGGEGDLAIGANGGGRVNVVSGGANPAVRVWDADDSVTIAAGGVLTADGIIRIDGAFLMNLGMVDAPFLQLGGAAPYSISGTINGTLAPASSNVSVVLAGDLTIGQPSFGTGGVSNLGLLDIGDHTLTILPSATGSPIINNCRLGPNGRIVSTRALSVTVGRTLSGDGTLDAPVDLAGAIDSTGSGLVFNNTLTSFDRPISGAPIRFGNGGRFTGSGTIGAAVIGDPSSSFVALGNLTMGLSGAAVGVDIAGGITCNANTVTLRSLDHVRIGAQTTLAGGTLACTAPGAIVMDGNDALFGSGGVSGAIEMNGNCTVSATGGNLSIGPHATGASLRGNGGTLDVGPNLVNLLGNQTSNLPARTTLAGGTLAAPSSLLTLEPNERIEGTGAVETRIFTAHGEIAPGNPTGGLSVVGQIVMTGTTVLDIGIAGVAAGAFDRLDVASTATLLGGTLRVTLLNGFVPPRGHVFDVLNCRPRVGVFSAVDLPPAWNVEYHTGGVRVISPCPADFNLDGFTDFFDYDDFVTCFESGVCPPGETADYNGDGFADFFDYDDFVAAFQSGC